MLGSSSVAAQLVAFRVVLNSLELLNLGCLHPVARVISYDVGSNPSTQRHYRRLIYYLYIHTYTCFGRTTIITLKNILLVS
jgi:hypothetical protein